MSSSSSKPAQNGNPPPGARPAAAAAAASSLTPPTRSRNSPVPTHRSALSVSTLPSSAASPPVRSPPLYAEADPAPPAHLGDLTPTSNTTPSPSARTPVSTIPESPSPTPSSPSSPMSLPPLSISPRVLESLQRQLVEKSTLLNLANDHISHQAVQIRHLQAKMAFYQQAQATSVQPLTVGVAGVEGAVGGVGRGEEVKQLRLLVVHLHGMIAARDEVIGEQDKELCYYQQQLRQLKEAREKEVEALAEAERERDSDRERLRVLEAEVAKMKDRERDRKDRQEWKEHTQPLSTDRRAHSEQTEEQMRQLAQEAARHRGEGGHQEELKQVFASSAVDQQHPASAPPVLPFRAQSEPATAAIAEPPPAEAASASSPSSPAVSSSAVSPPAPAGHASPLALSPLSSPSSAASTTPRPLLPKVRRSGPPSARASPQIQPQPAPVDAALAPATSSLTATR